MAVVVDALNVKRTESAFRNNFGALVPAIQVSVLRVCALKLPEFRPQHRPKGGENAVTIWLLGCCKRRPTER